MAQHFKVLLIPLKVHTRAEMFTVALESQLPANVPEKAREGGPGIWIPDIPLGDQSSHSDLDLWSFGEGTIKWKISLFFSLSFPFSPCHTPFQITKLNI